ncbi:hypothetical protein NKG05_13255 [Oerskovia sp. M15]
MGGLFVGMLVSCTAGTPSAAPEGASVTASAPAVTVTAAPRPRSSRPGTGTGTDNPCPCPCPAPAPAPAEPPAPVFSSAVGPITPDLAARMTPTSWREGALSHSPTCATSP